MTAVITDENPPGILDDVEDTVIKVPHVRYEYHMTILTALQSKPIYGGTVTDKEIARRRKANRVARSQNRLTINDRRK